MGASDAGPFDNDDAGDWTVELIEAEDWQPVFAALDLALEADGKDSGAEASAIAAAAVIALSFGNEGYQPSYYVVEEVTNFLERLGEPAPRNLTKLALKSIESAMHKNSELYQLWEGDREFLEPCEEIRDILLSEITRPIDPGSPTFRRVRRDSF